MTTMVALRSVEFWKEVRGPGSRNKSDMTATFATMKVKSGEKEPTPTGLAIYWDMGAHAIIIAQDGATDDPCVVYGWENVRRAIPVDPADVLPGFAPSPPKQAPPTARPVLA